MKIYNYEITYISSRSGKEKTVTAASSSVCIVDTNLIINDSKDVFISDKESHGRYHEVFSDVLNASNWKRPRNISRLGKLVKVVRSTTSKINPVDDSTTVFPFPTV